MSDHTGELHAIVAAAIAPLLERIELLYSEQQEHARLLAQELHV
jgi:hypothetical protein